MNELMTAAEVASVLRITEPSVWRLARQGNIPAVKIGHSWRFPADQIGLYFQGKWTPPERQSEKDQ